MTSPDQFAYLEPALLRRGVELFNQGEFFECHEVLEELWKDQPEPERQFTQGLIQLAVALHHLKNHNLDGTAKLLDRALPRLRQFTPKHHGLDLATLIHEAEEILTQPTGAIPRIRPYN